MLGGGDCIRLENLSIILEKLTETSSRCIIDTERDTERKMCV